MSQAVSCQGERSLGFPILELHTLSENFWQENQELFPQSVGLICLSGMGPEGQLVNLDTQKNPYKEVFSAIFDARHEAAGAFNWQLCWAEVGGGRTVHQYSTTQKETVTVTTADFDEQGRVRRQSVHPASRFGYPIKRILGESVVQTRLADLKALRHKAMLDLDDFNYNIAYKLSDFEAEKKRKELTDYIQHLVLSPLTPISLNECYFDKNGLSPVGLLLNLQQTLEPEEVR